MLFKIGDKVHVLIRRQFEKDIRRHIIGMVEDATDMAILIEGRKAVYNSTTANYDILEDVSTQAVSIIDSGVIISLIPEEVILEELFYESTPGMTIVTNGRDWSLRINEVGIGG